MNNSKIILTFAVLLIVASSCGSHSNKGVVYNPRSRTKFTSEEQRESAIAQKKAEAIGLLSDTKYTNAVKLSILVPKTSTDYSETAAQVLTMKMLKITSQNGIAGYGGDPSFVFSAIINPVNHGLTSTIPQKEYIKYNIMFYVVNIHSGDVYGCLEQEIMGVGKSTEEAIINAMQSVENNESISALLRDSSSKIVDWFESHKSSFITQVQDYLRRGEYAKAYGLLVSVPEEAKSCFEFAQKNIELVHEKYLVQESSSLFTKMQNVIAESGGDYNPEVAAYLEMIPSTSPIYSTAYSAFEEYVKKNLDGLEMEKVHQMHMEEEQAALAKLNIEAEIKAQETLALQYQTELSSQSVQENCEPDAVNDFFCGVKNGITTMLADKAQSVIFGGISNLLSFI